MKMDIVNLLTCDCVRIHIMEASDMTSDSLEDRFDKTLKYIILNKVSLCSYDGGSLKKDYSLIESY